MIAKQCTQSLSGVQKYQFPVKSAKKNSTEIFMAVAKASLQPKNINPVLHE